MALDYGKRGIIEVLLLLGERESTIVGNVSVSWASDSLNSGLNSSIGSRDSWSGGGEAGPINSVLSKSSSFP